MIPTSRKPGAALLAMRRAAQIHQYNHLALNLLIYHEVVTTSKAYITLAYFASPLRLMVRKPLTRLDRSLAPGPGWVSARMRYRSFIRATEEKQENRGGATSKTLRIRSYSSSK